MSNDSGPVVKGTKLKEEMKGTTKIFGRKDEIEVAFSGDSARVDGNLVVLPDIEGADLTTKQASVMRGFVDHESGVAKYSDTSLLQFVEKKSGDIGTIMSAIEDPRIDKQRIKEYVGARQNISDAVDSMCDSFSDGLKGLDTSDPDFDWRAYVGMAIATLGRRNTGLVCNIDRMRDILPQEAIDKYDEYESEIENASTTLQSLKLAVKIAKDLNLEIPEEIQEAAGGGGDMSGPSDGDEDGEGGSREGAKAADDDPEPIKGGILPTNLSQAIHFDVDKSSNGEYGEVFEQDVHLPVNLMVRGRLSNLFKTNDTMQRLSSWGKSGTNAGKFYLEDTYSSQPFEYGNRLFNDIMRHTGPSVALTRKKLEALLFSQLDRSWDGGKLDGKLDQRRLTLASRGVPNVFKHRAARKEIDAAVTLLIDLSGSMGDNKQFVAACCAIALSESLHKLSVPFCVMGFNTLYDLDIKNLSHIIPEHKALMDANQRAWLINKSISDIHYNRERDESIEKLRRSRVRFLPASIYHFKDFTDSYLDTRQSISLIARSAAGANHDAAGLYHAYKETIKRSEKKRVVIVLSDGQPSASGIPAHNQLLKLTKRIEEEKAVELMGIGICDKSVKSYYRRWAVVNDVEELPTKALTSLQKIIA